MNNLFTFLKEVRIELSKVIWPNRRQMVVYTLVVLGISAFIAVYLGILDFVFGSLLQNFIL